MSYELVNGLELWPHRPDWEAQPQVSMRWETKVASALDGSEFRSAIRNRVRRGVRFTCRGFDLSETHVMRSRLIEVDKVGRAACPLWGRGWQIESASGTTITLAAVPATPPEVGDFVFVCRWEAGEWESYDAVEVTAVSGATITVGTSLSQSYPSGCFAYPLVFGPFTHGNVVSVSNWTCSVDCEIIESQTNPTPLDNFLSLNQVRVIAIGEDEIVHPVEVKAVRVIAIGMDDLPAVDEGAPAWE